MAIKIKGVIGWDVVGTQFADMLSKLSGDITFEIDSPGGSVFDGISIFNAIKNYGKGKCNMHVVGECSSMASYIMLAGDTLKFEENSVVCIHNPWNCACGDYRAFQRNADILERLSALLASAYVKKGLFDEQTTRAIMDAETWFIGAKDLAKLGEVVKSSDENAEPQDREIAIAATREHIKEWQSRLRQKETDEFDKIAALIPARVQAQASTKTDDGVQPPQSKTDNTLLNKGDKKMNLEELKAQHPDLFAQAVKIGAEQEKSRVNALMNHLDNAKDIVVKAVTDGKSIQDDEVQSAILKARVNAQDIKAMEGDNPPEINPAEPPHAPETPEADKEKTGKEKEEAEAKQLAAVLGHLGYDAE